MEHEDSCSSFDLKNMLLKRVRTSLFAPARTLFSPPPKRLLTAPNLLISASGAAVAAHAANDDETMIDSADFSDLAESRGKRHS
jgi:hypothetical protein